MNALGSQSPLHPSNLSTGKRSPRGSSHGRGELGSGPGPCGSQPQGWDPAPPLPPPQ